MSGLWCVADGMGGHAKGDVASALIIENLRALTEQSNSISTEAIKQAIQNANNEIKSFLSIKPTIVFIPKFIICLLATVYATGTYRYSQRHLSWGFNSCLPAIVYDTGPYRYSRKQLLLDHARLTL